MSEAEVMLCLCYGYDIAVVLKKKKTFGIVTLLHGPISLNWYLYG